MVSGTLYAAIGAGPSVLNFLYGIVHREVEAALLGVGLAPAFGFYHQPRSSAGPLALDLMEEFRVPMVDMPLVASLNRKSWDPVADVEVASDHVWLSKAGRAKAIELFERRKHETWKHNVLGYSRATRASSSSRLGSWRRSGWASRAQGAQDHERPRRALAVLRVPVPAERPGPRAHAVGVGAGRSDGRAGRFIAGAGPVRGVRERVKAVNPKSEVTGQGDAIKRTSGGGSAAGEARRGSRRHL